MRFGILGGTFDPIHLGHLLMGEAARQKLGLQRVLFVPAGDPPHKQSEVSTPARHRRAMVELAIAGNPHFELCPVDLDRAGPHYSTDTVRLIRARYDLSADDCFFIIGADSLQDLPTWHRPEELLRLCRLAAIRRPGCRPDMAALAEQLPGLNQRLVWVDMPLIGISASDIRARLRAGQGIRYQVAEPVREYILAQHLYCQKS
jgi:nicotinate-nucleotide adenylyltransferase